MSEGALDVALIVPLADIGTFIEELLTLPDRQAQFCQSVREINFQRYDCHPAGLNRRLNLTNFLCVQQKPTRAIRIVIIRVPEIVFRNVGVVKRGHIVRIDTNERIRDIGAPGTQSFDFRSRKHQAGFVGFAELVVAPGLRIPNFRLLGIIFFLTHAYFKKKAERSRAGKVCRENCLVSAIRFSASNCPAVRKKASLR